MSLANKEYDFLFKIVIVGNSGVGKSSLLNRFADDTFSDTYLATIGVDFKFKTLPLESKKVKLQIWDTAGQERFRTITNAYYKGADAIIMVYDVTSQGSFEDISSFWHNEAECYGERDSLLMMIGNKSDLITSRAVSFEKAKGYCNTKNLMFFETSAKTSEGVETAFHSISQKLLEKKEKQIAQRRKEHREKRMKKSNRNNDSLLNLSVSSIEEKPVNLKPLEEQREKIQEKLKKFTCSC